MPFDFELTITGLIVVSIEKNADPAKPKAVELLVLDCGAHIHQPYISYRPVENIQAAAPPYDLLVPAPNGDMAALKKIDAFSSITIDAGLPPGNIEILWDNATSIGRKPFRKVPPLDHLDLPATALESDILNGTSNNHLQARVKLPNAGKLAADKIAMKNTTDEVIWDFKKGSASGEKQAIAENVVYKIENVPSNVIIDVDGQFITLEAKPSSNGVVRAGLTSMPPERKRSGYPGSKLSHFTCFYHLSKDTVSQSDQRIPEADAPPLMSGGSVICPCTCTQWP